MRIAWLVFCLLMFSPLAWSQYQCHGIYQPRTTLVLIETLNQEYPGFFYRDNLNENFDKSFWLKKKWHLFKLTRMLKSFDKSVQKSIVKSTVKSNKDNSSNNVSYLDAHEIYNFVYDLDRLLYASEKYDTKEARQITSEARRRLLMDGVAKYFNIRSDKSSFWMTFSGVFSQKYFRWLAMPSYMSKSVGLTLPVDLAKQIAIDGLESHRQQVEKYLPIIRTRAGFNQFSGWYNRLVLISLFTVVPYITNQFYQEQMKLGDQQAMALFEPVVQTTAKMAQVDHQQEKIKIIMQIYQNHFLEKHGRLPTADEMSAVRTMLMQKQR